MLDEDRADGVDGLVPVEALADETVCRMLHRVFIAKRKLILDDDMDCGERSRIRWAKIRPSVIVRHETDALRLIE